MAFHLTLRTARNRLFWAESSYKQDSLPVIGITSLWNIRCESQKSIIVRYSFVSSMLTHVSCCGIAALKKCPETGSRRGSVCGARPAVMLWILPVTVMLTAWLLSLYLDSHQYTPLSDCLTVFSSQLEEVRLPQPEPHWDKSGSKLGTHQNIWSQIQVEVSVVQ